MATQMATLYSYWPLSTQTCVDSRRYKIQQCEIRTGLQGNVAYGMSPCTHVMWLRPAFCLYSRIPGLLNCEASAL